MLKNKYSIIIFENSVILFGGTVPGLVLILVLGLPVVQYWYKENLEKCHVITSSFFKLTLTPRLTISSHKNAKAATAVLLSPPGAPAAQCLGAQYKIIER